MENNQKIQRIFSAPEIRHGISLFTAEELAAIESLIVEEAGRFLVRCQIKDKYKVAKPEEIVRQVFIHRLLREYGYPRERIDVERVVYFGTRESGLADIVVLHDDLTHPYIIFEVKRPRRRDGREQLQSYCNAEGAPIGVWSNGNEMIRLHREEPNIFVEIPRIPRVSETLRDVLTERWTIGWLEEHDELRQGRTTLKKILLDLEELVLGNAGVDPFEEIFKLIYSKLYDEWRGINDPEYQLEFFVGDRSPSQVKRAIGNLLEGARRQWRGVFEPTDMIELRDDHLKVCVSFLRKIKLFNSNLRIIDEAFEYLIPQVSKKKEGQFFTPRPAEDMVAKMLNPKSHEFVIDPACGSAGFLLHSVIWIAGGMITGRDLPPAAKNFAQDNIMGIDFAKKAVRIAKAINLIVGDGRSHIYRDNSLAPQTWKDESKAGLRPRLRRFPSDPDKDRENQSGFMYFDFDVLMTNPPFAGTVKERDILRLYELAEKKGRLVRKIGRHILFLERSLQFIRPGGRMAIVLPQGLLTNTNTEDIRRFLIDEARILAVVGLHGNTFKPHTGTKTSVLFLQKYTDEERQTIQELKAKHEEGWEAFLAELRTKYQDIRWDQAVAAEEVPAELTSFIETYFETREELEEEQTEGTGAEQRDEATEDLEEAGTRGRMRLEMLVADFESLQEARTGYEDRLGQLARDGDELKQFKKSLGRKRETREQRKAIDERLKALREEGRPLKKDVRALIRKLAKLHREISERVLGGQIWLALNEEKVTGHFKQFWLDGKVMKEMDYPIFFAVNKKPLKDNKGQYRYVRGPSGEHLLDSHEHPIIDHDLDEIAEAFVEFAKDQGFGFWRA